MDVQSSISSPNKSFSSRLMTICPQMRVIVREIEENGSD